VDLLVALGGAAISFGVGYLVIRLAVNHGVADAIYEAGLAKPDSKLARRLG
jgi:hypothetical protein